MKVYSLQLSDEDASKLDELIEREQARDAASGERDVSKPIGPTGTIRRLIRRAHDDREFRTRTGKYAEEKT